MEVETEMPTTLAEAVAGLEDYLDGITDDECSREETVAEVLADYYDEDEETVRSFYRNNPALDWVIGLWAEYHITHRGAGWGSPYGPEPDEYDGEVTVSVSDGDRTLTCESGSYEDVGGGWAAKFIAKRLA